MIVLKQHRIYRSDLKNNPSVLYLFGDNLERKGLGGQAAEMRGEPNAFGIATKRNAAHDPNSYFDDSDNTDFIIRQEIFALQHQILSLKPKVLIIPSDGIGTGLAKMSEKCPSAFQLLTKLLNLTIYQE